MSVEFVTDSEETFAIAKNNSSHILVGRAESGDEFQLRFDSVRVDESDYATFVSKNKGRTTETFTVPIAVFEGEARDWVLEHVETGMVA